jgi:hypothetical protein
MDGDEMKLFAAALSVMLIGCALGGCQPCGKGGLQAAALRHTQPVPLL